MRSLEDTDVAQTGSTALIEGEGAGGIAGDTDMMTSPDAKRKRTAMHRAPVSRVPFANGYMDLLLSSL